MTFQLAPGGFLQIRTITTHIGKKYWDLETCRKSLKMLFFSNLILNFYKTDFIQLLFWFYPI
jgi:hypothetical protein